METIGDGSAGAVASAGSVGHGEGAGQPEPVYRFDPPLSEAVLVRRAGRFTLETILAGGQSGLLHLPNSGRLETVLAPGARILYRPRPRTGALVTEGRAVVADAPGVGWVTIDATLLSRAFSHILRALAACRETRLGPPLADLRTEFGPYCAVRDEVAVGRHRFDIGLRAACGAGRDTCDGPKSAAGDDGLLLEVKSVTLARDGVALFPDAPTRRGAEHVRVLGEMAARGRRTGLVFAVGRGDAHVVRPNAALDPAFASSLRWAAGAGLKVTALFLKASAEGIRLARRLPVELDA